MCVELMLNSSHTSHKDNCSLSITYKCHICPRYDAFKVPASITSQRLAGAQQGLAEHTSLVRGRRNARAFAWLELTVLWAVNVWGAVQREPQETKGKALAKRPTKAAGLNIIRGKRESLPLFPLGTNTRWYQGTHQPESSSGLLRVLACILASIGWTKRKNIDQSAKQNPKSQALKKMFDKL